MRAAPFQQRTDAHNWFDHNAAGTRNSLGFAAQFRPKKPFWIRLMGCAWWRGITRHKVVGKGDGLFGAAKCLQFFAELSMRLAHRRVVAFLHHLVLISLGHRSPSLFHIGVGLHRLHARVGEERGHHLGFIERAGKRRAANNRESKCASTRSFEAHEIILPYFCAPTVVCDQVRFLRQYKQHLKNGECWDVASQVDHILEKWRRAADCLFRITSAADMSRLLRWHSRV